MKKVFFSGLALLSTYAVFAVAQPIRQSNPSASSGVAWSGNAATATALAANPSDCGSGYVAVGINASGTAQCAVVDDTAGGTDASTNTVTSNVLRDHAVATAAGTHGSASANTASVLVHRDASGNFSAGTISASVTGASSLNVLKAGDTMTGALSVTGPGGISSTYGVSAATGTFTSSVTALGFQVGSGAYDQASRVRINNTGTTIADTGLTLNSAGSGGYALDIDASGAYGGLIVRSGTRSNISNALSVGSTALSSTNTFQSNGNSAINGGLYVGSGLAVASFIQAASKTVAQLEAITPTVVGQIYYCSDCTNAVHVVVSTGSAVCQFDSFTGGVAWH